MSDDYGFLAPFYQPLSRLVFGKDLIAANSCFSSFAQDRHSLIIGGGDGSAYKDWDGRYTGEYWDTSAKMAELAGRNLKKSRIRVHCGHWLGDGTFDVVFLPFVLDTLLDSEIDELVRQVHAALKPGGRVILSDFFTPATFFQRALQRLMLISFRLFTNHRRKDLPEYANYFDSDAWEKESSKVWRKGWIRAQLYLKKQGSTG
ncbi:class I SAM-dependent methyltransferase [Algoriphagus aestuariicola]|uniref:Class I SAM-dependent methyltransferase n=1 Tax=Algoriphagus aestuariicola TaxID=1852016 RepID=A0ABS3BYE2_9BACT|nr:class I SAM-dependent methyltransferase [Algoriphagus aestuariicola]MBN7802739.1 class I SAM-dependent methyltransferase [Algoriphagus aestuariicola]